ncbi:unnamed protein product [Bursaphelenchus xylophilus]|uniref:(pine wood nematode) hypothetical protein n=1 Tax=Bursaphelenchus xylophilus TaxID=6326 RepID=A0A1I7SLE0_BURXY|nr:unnamed protein product [Bursaphelenchus xylophilus]CAG9129524.1 unnamed protein product [Bursaphelenchus xylophilus]
MRNTNGIPLCKHLAACLEEPVTERSNKKTTQNVGQEAVATGPEKERNWAEIPFEGRLKNGDSAWSPTHPSPLF